MLGITAPLELVAANPETSSETMNSTVNSPPDAVSVAGESVMNSAFGAVVSVTSA